MYVMGPIFSTSTGSFPEQVVQAIFWEQWRKFRKNSLLFELNLLASCLPYQSRCGFSVAEECCLAAPRRCRTEASRMSCFEASRRHKQCHRWCRNCYLESKSQKRPNRHRKPFPAAVDCCSHTWRGSGAAICTLECKLHLRFPPKSKLTK